MALKGIEYLRKKLQSKQTRVDVRYKYYGMKNVTRDLGISTPPELRGFVSTLGWCGTAVDALADRLVFDRFKNDRFNINEIFMLNNSDVLFDSAMLSALISSCSFVYISQSENGFPRLQVIDGYDATGEIDTFTNMLTEGYAVLGKDSYGNPTLEAYFVAGRTDYYMNGKLVDSYTNNVPYPLLVPIIYRPDSNRPFGRSRISRACMSIQDGAVRTVKRSEISAEFFSYPQRYALGIEDSESMDKWKAAMSSMFIASKDEDGDLPKLGQFEQQSMAPHIDHLKMFASQFAGETGLTLDDLGFPTENPSSAEAIKAAHEGLRLTARKAQRNFGNGFLNVGFLAACLRDNYDYARSQIYQSVPVWAPIFEPDMSTLSVMGDGIIKMNQAVPGYITPASLEELTGIKRGE